MNASFTLIGFSLLLFLGPVKTNENTGNAHLDSGPRIHFDSTLHDFGTLPFGGDGRCTFIVTNTGDEPLIITSFKTSCGCLVPHYDQTPVMPGASSEVSLRYDTRRPGPINKSATITSNAVDFPTVVLRIKGFVLQDTATRPMIPR
jgi:hypothetical protein